MQISKQQRQEMFKRGEEHARAGKQCTPFDCQELDRELFNACRGQAGQAKWYAAMRGAFNAGWQRAYFAIVSA